MYKKVDIIKKYDNKQQTNFDHFLLKIFFEDNRWIHANPTLYQSGHSSVHDRYKTFYSENKQVEVNLASFYRFVTNDGENIGKFVSIKGKRGSGKTSFINYFFNKHTRHLNKGNNKDFGYSHKPLTWVRIDATKVYKYNMNHNVPIDFDTYLYAQLLFVFFRYGQKDKSDIYFPEKVNGGSGCRNSGSFSTTSHDSVLASFSEEFQQIIKTDDLLQEQYEEVEKMTASSKVSQFSNGLEGKPFQYSKLGKVLFELVKDNLIVVIDGIDNIHYDSILKESAWKYLEDFLENFGTLNKNSRITGASAYKVVLSMRDENLSYFANKLPHLNLHEAEEQEIINHVLNINSAVSFSDVLDKFHSYVAYEQTEEVYTEADYHTFLKNFLTLYKQEMLQLFDDRRIDIDKEVGDSIKRFLKEKLTDELLDGGLKEIEKVLEDSHFFLADSLIHKLKICGYEMGDQIKNAILFKFKRENEYRKRAKDPSLRKRVINQPLTHYFTFVSHFNDVIHDGFSKKSGYTFTSKNMLEHFFNGDMREMMIVSYKTYSAFVDFMLNEDPRMKENTYNSFEVYLEERYWIVMASLFKNGNLYYADRRDVKFYAPYRNVNIVNPLNICYFKESVLESSYYVYILAYLREGSRSIKDVADFFKLSDKKEIVRKVLNNYLEYGYIEYVEVDSVLLYRATTKGKAILHYSFRDIPVLQSYIFDGLIESSLEELFKRPIKGEYASSLQFNMVLLYYMLEVEKGNLLARGIQINDLDVDIITTEAKDDFLGYFETNPYLFKNIHNYIGEMKDGLLSKENPRYEKSFADNLIEFVRERLLGYADYETWYEDKKKYEIFKNNLTLQEKYVYVKEFLGFESEKIIVNDMRCHNFIFDTVDFDRSQDRIDSLKSIDTVKYFKLTKDNVLGIAVKNKWVSGLAK